MSVMMIYCCVTQEQEQPTRRHRIIDRTMIGLPTNFRHTGHIGANDVADVDNNHVQLDVMQTQLQLKSGFTDTTRDYKLSHLKLIDVERKY